MCNKLNDMYIFIIYNVFLQISRDIQTPQSPTDNPQR